MKISYYKQCTVEKGTTQYTVWIPEGFAKMGDHLKLNGDDGWKVIAVYSLRLTEDEVNKAGSYYRTHREGTDV